MSLESDLLHADNLSNTSLVRPVPWEARDTDALA